MKHLKIALKDIVLILAALVVYFASAYLVGVWLGIVLRVAAVL